MTIYLKKEELKFLIEPWFYSYLKKDLYEIHYIEAYKLLSKTRFDIYSKIIFLDYIDNYPNNFEELYLSFIKAFTLGTFKEPGNKNKHGSIEYLKTFSGIYKNISRFGFIYQKSIIPVSNDGIILNGAHRLAVATKLNLKVPTIKLDYNAADYGYGFFKERRVPAVFLDQSAIKLVNLKKNLRIAIIWPSADRKKVNLEEIIPNIHYKKDIKFNFDGLQNLINCVYSKEKFLGTIDNGFKGARAKATLCYSNKWNLTVYVFEPSNEDNVIDLKRHIRKKFGIGKSSIHINDNYEELKNISEILFNENTISFLNKIKFKSHSKRFLKQLDEFKDFVIKNKLNYSDLVLDGSIVMSVFNLREARDIDYLLHSSNQKKIIVKKYNINNHNNEFEKYSKKIVDLIIKDNRYFFTFDSIRFLSPNILFLIKKERNENKDKIDNSLIKSLLNNNPILFLYSTILQETFFLLLKIRSLLINLLRYLKLYNILKKIIKMIYK